jgi:hypothetical protein
MIDEMACRRPEFNEEGSISVTLADGQQWFFPRPAVELYPKGPDGKFGSRTSLGPDFDRAIDAMIAVPRVDAEADPDGAMEAEALYIECQFRVAAIMLSRNYEIPDDGWREILRFSYQIDTYRQMWDDIFTVARGSDPRGKPGPATSGPPS